MLKGNFCGTTLGSGTDAWKYWAERAPGTSTTASGAIEDGIARSPGHCMTMGTASTMTAIAETLGLTLPGARRSPPCIPRTIRMAARRRRIVEMVWEDLQPSDILTQEAFDNAITVDDGHRRLDQRDHPPDRDGGPGRDQAAAGAFDEISHRTPVIANLRPSGEYLMEDFYDAGGLRALLERIRHMLHTDCPTVNGKSLGENIAGREGL
jgi:dihydroxy-acid dehydratase